MIEIEWLGQTLQLLASRAIYWPAQETLLIADTHFGKAAAFRRAGIPIPSGTTESDLARLDQLLASQPAQRLIVLGDFFHARSGRHEETMRVIGKWRAANPIEMMLLRGNHDRASGDPPAEWNIRCVTGPFALDGLTLAHDPAEADGAPVLAGHVHPAVLLPNPAGRPLRTACFWFSSRCGILPAFGAFTGMYNIIPAADDRVYAVGPDAVMQVPARAWTGRRARFQR